MISPRLSKGRVNIGSKRKHRSRHNVRQKKLWMLKSLFNICNLLDDSVFRRETQDIVIEFLLWQGEDFSSIITLYLDFSLWSPHKYRMHNAPHITGELFTYSSAILDARMKDAIYCSFLNLNTYAYESEQSSVTWAFNVSNSILKLPP